MNKPTTAYVMASWAALFVGIAGFLFGLWRADMQLNEKGYYLAVLLLGLYSAISLQKCVRDRAEGIAVSDLYYLISWVVLGISLVLIAVGLYNATLLPSEKGFYAMAFTLGLYAVISIQKNVRDMTSHIHNDGLDTMHQHSFYSKNLDEPDE